MYLITITLYTLNAPLDKKNQGIDIEGAYRTNLNLNLSHSLVLALLPLDLFGSHLLASKRKEKGPCQEPLAKIDF